MSLVKMVTVKKHMTLLDRSVNVVLDLGEIDGDDMRELYNLEKKGEAVCLLAPPDMIDKLMKVLQENGT